MSDVRCHVTEGNGQWHTVRHIQKEQHLCNKSLLSTTSGREHHGNKIVAESQVEKAGGQSSGDGKGISGLDIVCEKHDQVPLHMHSLAVDFFIKRVLFDDFIAP